MCSSSFFNITIIPFFVSSISAISSFASIVNMVYWFITSQVLLSGHLLYNPANEKGISPKNAILYFSFTVPFSSSHFHSKKPSTKMIYLLSMQFLKLGFLLLLLFWLSMSFSGQMCLLPNWELMPSYRFLFFAYLY